jgi:hypothetical protein
MILQKKTLKLYQESIKNSKLFWQSSRIQINTQKSVSLFYTKNEKNEKEFREIILFIVASK